MDRAKFIDAFEAWYEALQEQEPSLPPCAFLAWDTYDVSVSTSLPQPVVERVFAKAKRRLLELSSDDYEFARLSRPRP